jgi:hypothetical protein
MIGLVLLLFLTPFLWGMAANADVTTPFLFRGPLAKVEGVVTAVSKTSASEGRSPIYEVAASYAAEGGAPLQSKSYVRAFPPKLGEAVTLEYPAGRPDVARIVGSRRALFGPGALMVFLFVLPALGLVLFAARSGARDVRLLGFGQLASARFVSSSPTGSSVNNRPVMALRFSFRGSDGAEHVLEHRTSQPEALTDESQEQVLYLPEAPERGRVVDGLPGSAIADERGELQGAGHGLKVALALALLVALANVACGVLRFAR